MSHHDGIFPAAPPPSVTDSASIRTHDWDAFRAIDAMHNHWDRPGWTPTRQSYHFFVTAPNHPELLELTRHCQHALTAADPASFDLVPPTSLHLTVLRAGFTDQLSQPQVRELVATARRCCADMPAFGLSVGPLAGSRGAIRFSVTPWDQLLDLYARLGAATNSALAANPRSDRGLRPHISIAYANRTIPIGPVIQTLTPLRTLRPVDLEVRTIRLVALRREQHGQRRTYQWQELAAIPVSDPPRRV